MPEFTTIARVGDVAEGCGETFHVGDRAIALFLVEGKYYALDDRCPHMGASLGIGDVIDDSVRCDRHLWTFRLADGVCADSSELKAGTFEVRVEGDEVQVRIADKKEGGSEGERER